MSCTSHVLVDQLHFKLCQVDMLQLRSSIMDQMDFHFRKKPKQLDTLSATSDVPLAQIPVVSC